MFTAVLGAAGASKSTTVISNYYLLGHKLMSLSIIGPIFPILHYVNFRKQVGFIQSPQCFLSFLVSYHYRDTM